MCDYPLITAAMIEEIIEDEYVLQRQYGNKEKADAARTRLCDFRVKWMMGLEDGHGKTC